MWSLDAPLLLLLLPLPVLAARLLAPAETAADALRLPERIAAGFGDAEALRLHDRMRRALPALIWIALVVALAGPERVAPSAALPASGRDVALAIDLSGSMETRDFTLDGRQVERVEAVRRVAAAFARGREGDRLGLVVFGEEAFFAAPMTWDVEAVARTVEEMTIGLTGRTTAISDGLGLALRRLADSDASARVVVLLSDGVDTSGSVAPLRAAELAQDLGVRVHTIAMGPVALGEAGATREAVDAPTLAAMAEATGGRSFRVRSTDDLLAVSAEIDAMEPSLRDRGAPAVHRPYWPWAAALALAAALGLILDPRRGA